MGWVACACAVELAVTNWGQCLLAKLSPDPKLHPFLLNSRPITALDIFRCRYAVFSNLIQPIPRELTGELRKP